MQTNPRDDAPRHAYHLRAVSAVRAGRRVLAAVDCEMAWGRVTVVIGPSGSGKSSLLRLLNRLDDPSAGTIVYRDRPLAAYDVRQLRCRVGFVFQTPVMFPGTVRDNLLTATRLARVAEADVTDRAVRALALAELSADLMDRNGEELSVGQRQRANLARALISSPETLLLDEPTSALDPATAKHLLATVRRLSADDGLTVVLATHRLVEARAVAEHAIVLRDGSVAASGEALPLLAALDSAEGG